MSFSAASFLTNLQSHNHFGEEEQKERAVSGCSGRHLYELSWILSYCIYTPFNYPGSFQHLQANFWNHFYHPKLFIQCILIFYLIPLY